MGPTVCELDGPIPILKRSKTLIAKVTPVSHAGEAIAYIAKDNT
jgi:hypothetical protein